MNTIITGKSEDNSSRNSEDRQWQNRLLPLMSKMIIILTAFFFLASLSQLIYLHIRIDKDPERKISESYSGIPDSSDLTYEENMQIAQFKALIILEAEALERRHHQANVLLMSRVWARYLGFVTGMILSLVGAVFILGKLQESDTQLKADTKAVSISLRSASPGIILVVLGVSLMLTTIVTHHDISVTDVPVYIDKGDIIQATTAHGDKPPLD